MEHIHHIPEQTTSSLSEAALAYAHNGWPVFPLAGKVPYEGTHGHRDATVDAGTIMQLWRQHPKANIGLATGRFSGMLVLDMDVTEGYYALQELEKQYERLPETCRSPTVSGGLHYFFLYPDDAKIYPNTVGLTGRIGLDVRGEGGYVVLPPSRLYGKKYYRWANPQTPLAELPDWLQTLLPTKGEQRTSPQDFGFASQSGEKWLDEAVSRATEGNRNDIGFWLACQLRDDGMSQEHVQALLLAYANRVPQEKRPYTSKEAFASVKSAFSRHPRDRAKNMYR